MSIETVIFGLILIGIGAVGGVLYERRQWQKATKVLRPRNVK